MLITPSQPRNLVVTVEKLLIHSECRICGHILGYGFGIVDRAHSMDGGEDAGQKMGSFFAKFAMGLGVNLDNPLSV